MAYPGFSLHRQYVSASGVFLLFLFLVLSTSARRRFFSTSMSCSHLHPGSLFLPPFPGIWCIISCPSLSHCCSPISPGSILLVTSFCCHRSLLASFFSFFVVWSILLFDICHRHSCAVYIRCAWCRRERCLTSSSTALLSYPFPLLQLPDTIHSERACFYPCSYHCANPHPDGVSWLLSPLSASDVFLLFLFLVHSTSAR